jgi:hypothetical protein
MRCDNFIVLTISGMNAVREAADFEMVSPGAMMHFKSRSLTSVGMTHRDGIFVSH